MAKAVTLCGSSAPLCRTPSSTPGGRCRLRITRRCCVAGANGITPIACRRTHAKPLEVQWGLTGHRHRTAQGFGDNGLPDKCRTHAAASLAGSMVSVSTLYCIPFFALMVVAPRLKWVRDMMETPWFIAPVAVVYIMLLVQSWEPDTLSLMMPGDLEQGIATGKPQFFPEISGISKLFSRATTAASLWVHLLCINLFAARHIYLDGLSNAITTRHSVLISSVAGPLGLLCHIATKAIAGIFKPRKEDEARAAPVA